MIQAAASGHAHTILVFKDREEFTGISGPTRLQGSNAKDILIDGFG